MADTPLTIKTMIAINDKDVDEFSFQDLYIDQEALTINRQVSSIQESLCAKNVQMHVRRNE